MAALRSSGLGELAEDAGLAVGELVANAVLHGAAPIRVRVRRQGDGIRLQVADASPVLPDVLDVGPYHTVGRGLAIVEAVSARWGHRRRSGGKVVWCELRLGLPARDSEHPDLDVAVARLAAQDDPPPGRGADSEWAVRVPDVPVRELRDYVLQVDEQVRELRLAAGPGGAPSLAALADQIREWTGRPGDRALLRAQALAAGRAGLERVDVVLDLSLSAVEAGDRHLAASDEIDTHRRAGGLLAVTSSATQRCFRRWLLGELAAGVGRAAGLPAPGPRRFESALAREVDQLEVRLSSGRYRPDGPAVDQEQTGGTPQQATGPAGTSGVDGSAPVVSFTPTTDAMFGQLLDTAPDAMVAVDASGTIRMVNHQTEALFGYHRNELVGRPLEVLVPEAFRGVHPAHRARYAQDPATRPMGAGLELSGRRRDGSQFPADISLSWINTPAGPLATAAVRDTTSWRATREALRESRQIAEVLQRSLLDAVPDQVGRLDVAVRYRPALSNAMVGGDWHDVFPLDGGLVGVSVGDIGGKGIQAAAAMGRVRTALAAVAAAEPSPGMVLNRVNRMMCRLATDLDGSTDRERSAPELLATALYGRLDVSGREFVYAVAGHPGPIVIDTAGRTAWMHDPEPNLPLGLAPSTRHRQQCLRLPAEGKLLAFTDGLFERRDTPLQESLDALVGHATRLAGCTEKQIADTLLDAATHGQPDWADDIALVVAGWSAVPD
jgi:PAS domain S-box-containing protein